jgi:hypothetical protein
MIPSITISQVTGTGAALSVAIGFVPDRIEARNRTTGRTVTWFRGMGAGTGDASGNGVTPAAVTAGQGFSAMNSTTLGDGFTIGVDAINTAGQVIDFIASRSGPGASNT